jgi:hypothetical protein
MSATSASAYSTVRGWTEGRKRRARMFGVLLAAAAVAALWAATQPWFGWATAGPISCTRPAVTSPVTVKTSTGASVSGVYASGCVSGRGLVDGQSTTNTAASTDTAYAQAARSLTSTSPRPAAMFGEPKTVAVFALLMAVGILALILRSTVLGVLATVAVYVPHSELGKLEVSMTTGTGGSLTIPEHGLVLYGYALLIGWGLLLTGTVFVAKHNSAERSIAVEKAKADGVTPPPGLFDHVAAFVGGKAAQVLDAADAQRRATNAATSETADRKKPVPTGRAG